MGNIRIRLMSDMCAGNGESVGYGIDSDICADNYGFPYIPGKRILGCLREAAVQLGIYGLDIATTENITEIFGDADGKEGKLHIGNAVLPGVESMHSYILSLKEEPSKRAYLIRQSTEEKILRKYTTVRGQTRIGEGGKAENSSLRFVRVLNQYDPISGNHLEFECTISASGLNKEQINLVKNACNSLRHMGLNRNRGLGNIFVIPDFDEKSLEEMVNIKEFSDEATSDSEQVMLRYKVEFDEPVTIQEYMENGTQIKARTLIGVFSGIYLKKYAASDENFSKLFLDGTVKWSALTPVVNGIESEPVPAMIMKLKNDGGKLVNSFSCEDKEWKKKKPKSMDGYYASVDHNSRTFFVAQPETESSYHNRINDSEETDHVKKGLYVQMALKQGLVYGGYVILPKALLPQVKELFDNGEIRLGRSKKVQYGTATITTVKITDYVPGTVHVEDGETVFAILKSDLVLQENATIRIDNTYVRNKITEMTGLQNILPQGINDINRYHILTGYHTMWHMQKPKIQAVMGGSVYCFKGKKGEYPGRITIGEYQQEGLGVIELVPMSKMREMTDIQKGIVSIKKDSVQEDVKRALENMLLSEAVHKEMEEYAFRFKQADDAKQDTFYWNGYKSNTAQKDEQKLLKDIPAGRLRRMLQDADSIGELWEMVENMKTSDVSSESVGKRKKSEELLREFYGDNHNRIDIDRLIADAGLLDEVKRNQVVYENALRHWKEPLFTLLHMVHYQKGRR